jgi:hypothetical protein
MIREFSDPASGTHQASSPADHAGPRVRPRNRFYDIQLRWRKLTLHLSTDRTILEMPRARDGCAFVAVSKACGTL